MADGHEDWLGLALVISGIILVSVGFGLNALSGAFFGPSVTAGNLSAIQAHQFAQSEVAGFWIVGAACTLIGIIMLAT
ncbi:MAG TPA: hypothetical protein VEC02_06125 [Nitrososphaerales archaeon]|nr:hypothetical protein [Nitrososphaerales archaeon]